MGRVVCAALPALNLTDQPYNTDGGPGMWGVWPLVLACLLLRKIELRPQPVSQLVQFRAQELCREQDLLPGLQCWWD